MTTNVYGNLTPARASLKTISDGLIRSFREYFAAQGYVEHPPAKITSGIDPSVRFIGSHISVLKPYLLRGNIPQLGFFMSQNCVRTRNLKCMYDDSPIKWGSYFNNFGTLSQPQQLSLICLNTFDFLQSKLGIDKDLMKTRVSSRDKDLVDCSRSNLPAKNVELDSQKPEYYRHRYGIEGVFGRNFNIALKDSKGEGFTDVGNIVLIESADGPIGVELGLGNSTIIKQLYGISHVLDVYNISGINKIDENAGRKFEDCMVVALALFGEGLRPSSKRCGQSLRQYLDAMNFFRLQEGMSMENLEEILGRFELHEFGSLHTRAHREVILALEDIQKRLNVQESQLV